MAAAYDLFGNGKTALKVNLGKYLEATITGVELRHRQPDVAHRARTSTRNWTDAQRQLRRRLRPARTRPRRTSARAAAISAARSRTRNFGTTVVQQHDRSGDPQRLGRPAVGLAVRRLGAAGMLPRVSVEVGYFRRWFQGFIVDRQPRGHGRRTSTQFSVTAPLDSRLPGGGGYTVGRSLRRQPGAVRRDEQLHHLLRQLRHAVPAIQRHRLQRQRAAAHGLTMQGGFSIGKTMADNCEIRAKLPEIAPLNPFCHVETGYLPQFKLLGNYMIPKIDVQASVTYTSKPGLQVSGFGTPAGVGGALAANYTVANAVIAAAARPPAVRRRRQRHRQPHRARRAVWRSRQRTRPASRQDPASSAARGRTSAWTSTTC